VRQLANQASQARVLLDDGLDTANTSAVGPGLVIAIVRGMIREIIFRRIIIHRRIERGGS
jgi:hypothetical protein